MVRRVLHVFEILVYLPEEVRRRAAEDVFVARLLAHPLPFALLLGLPPVRGLHLDGEASVSAVGDEEDEVGHPGGGSFGLEERAGDGIAAAAVGDGEEEVPPPGVFQSEQADAGGLQAVFLVAGLGAGFGAAGQALGFFVGHKFNEELR